MESLLGFPPCSYLDFQLSEVDMLLPVALDDLAQVRGSDRCLKVTRISTLDARNVVCFDEVPMLPSELNRAANGVLAAAGVAREI
jgi:hypothetical protein